MAHAKKLRHGMQPIHCSGPAPSRNKLLKLGSSLPVFHIFWQILHVSHFLPNVSSNPKILHIPFPARFVHRSQRLFPFEVGEEQACSRDCSDDPTAF
ncbi:hypothetical protein BaRGS_00032286 [Batillaria attramentaria]|uniref:Uncharacterized protein n=1 Tax=Batillaria attramentaria TaxID=370345 RepID=A0ABD0JNA7_9CAEN